MTEKFNPLRTIDLRRRDKVRLAAFIRSDTSRIVSEWEAFAKTLLPASEDMSPRGLRNHIKEILAFVADDIESSQTAREQVEKSHGEKPKTSEHSAAVVHAALRQAGGFSLDQMVSEFRALRASVIKLWAEELGETTSADISDLTRFNEALDQTLTESINYYSQTLDASRNLVLGILGHDLLNPLASAKMSAQLAMMLGTLNERQTMLIGQVIESTSRANSIVLSLLDLARARLGSGLPIIAEHMDMAFVGRQLVEEMRVIHPDRTFNLEVSGDTEGVWDKPRIGQVFSNLLGNAVRYGFADVPIRVTIKGGAKEVILSVHNDGVPIAPDAIGKIFDAFTRGGTEENRPSPGSTNLGLGLYIVKEIVSAHDGTLDVTSSESDGTTFTAHFPRPPA